MVAKLDPRKDNDSGRRVLSDSVAETLEARILDGTFRPGDRLPPERELAERLQVNRSSIREALKKLEQLRLVEIHQGSGIRVRRLEDANLEFVRRLLFQGGRPNIAWLRDLLELREVVLLGLVRLGLERATELEITRLVETVERAARPEISDEEFLELTLAIQDTSSQMTHNQVVLLLWNTLRRLLSQPPFEDARERIVRDRRELIPALRRFAHAASARDVESAQRAVRDLLKRLEQAALTAIQQLAGAREPGAEREGS